MTWLNTHSTAALPSLKVPVDDGVTAGGGHKLASELAGLGFNLRGAWAASTAYAVNDVVAYQGSSYAALTAFTSSSSFNGSNWQQLASKGDTGATGAGGAATVSGVSINGTAIVASPGAPYQMLTADRVIDVTKGTGAPTGILLPAAPTLWVEYRVIDGKGDAGTNNITVSGGNGVTINGTASFVMNANNDALSLVAVNSTTWRIV